MCTIHIKSGHMFMWYSGTFSVYTYITVYIHIPHIARLSIRHIKHCVPRGNRFLSYVKSLVISALGINYSFYVRTYMTMITSSRLLFQ